MELTQEIVNLKIDQFKSFGSTKREKDLNRKTKKPSLRNKWNNIKRYNMCNWSPKREDQKENGR